MRAINRPPFSMMSREKRQRAGLRWCISATPDCKGERDSSFFYQTQGGGSAVPSLELADIPGQVRSGQISSYIDLTAWSSRQDLPCAASLSSSTLP